tara:strand:+ start:12213 stop:12377 length:165 start_codon:yes stop_codon:yes gene_type:complete
LKAGAADRLPENAVAGNSVISLPGEKRYHGGFGATGADGGFRPAQDPHGRLGQK